MLPAEGQPASWGDYLLERRFRLVSPWLPTDSESLIDYGCGNGAQTLLFADRFRRIDGVDITRAGLDAFRAEADLRGLGNKVRLHLSNGVAIPLPENAADCLMSFEVLEHVTDQKAVLAEMRRVLQPDGVMILSVPNRWWIFETHGANLPWLPWNRVPLFSWLPKTLHDRWARARIYRRREIVTLLEASGFIVEKAVYVTAPMDMLKWEPLRKLMRASIFGSDTTGLPWLATSIMIRARPAAEPALSSPSRN